VYGNTAIEGLSENVHATRSGVVDINRYVISMTIATTPTAKAALNCRNFCEDLG
jgi:hypothetical protein